MDRLLSVVLLWGFLALPFSDTNITTAMQNGALLRMHVLAQDDTPTMQAVKWPVRDAVRETYAALADPDLSMQENAAALLPQLTEAARSAAVEAGFSGEVAVMLGTVTFDARVLEGVVIPAGDYPALIVRLGEGRGHNWWGLIDPKLSLLAACAGEEETIVWDWSPRALWQAILWGLGWQGGGTVG